MFSRIKQILAPPNIAVDLGTANTRVYASGFGAFAEQPSLVCQVEGEVTRPPVDEYVSYLNQQEVSMPLRGGVIVDIRNAVNLLTPLLKQTRKGLRHPASLACAPTDTSPGERELLTEAILHAGASHVALIPEVWAAALGADMDVTLPWGQLLIDIGEGVTDMAVIRDGHIVHASAVRTACSDLQEAVRAAILARHKVHVGHDELERLTHEIAFLSLRSAIPDRLITVTGMNIIKRRRVSIEVECREVVVAMEPVISRMLEMIEYGLRLLPENTACEIVESGICLTGGGARIAGIDRLIAEKTGLAVRVPPDPLHSVINGAIKTLNYWEGKGCWWENLAWPDYQRIRTDRCQPCL